MADAPAFDMDATLQAVKAAAQPTGSYGLVYELWQQAYNRNLENEVTARVPHAHQDAVLEALRAAGDLAAPETFEREEGTCRHFLDAQTCPCGCFEGEEEDLCA